MEVPSPSRPLASDSHSHSTRLTSSPSPPSTIRAESSSATGLRNAQFSRPALPTLMPLNPIKHEQNTVTASNGSRVETVAKRRNTHGEASLLSTSPQQKASSSSSSSPVAGLGQHQHTSLYTLKGSERATSQGKPYVYGSTSILGLRVSSTEPLEKLVTRTDAAQAFKRESVTESKPALPGLMPSKLHEPTPPLAVGAGLPQLRRPASPSPLAPAQLNDVVTPRPRGGVLGGIRGLATASYGALSSSPAAASSPYAPSSSNDNTSSPSSPYTMNVGGASIRKSLSVMRAGSVSVASSPNNNSGVSSKALSASPLRSGSAVRVSPFDLIRRNGSALRDGTCDSLESNNQCINSAGVNGSSGKNGGEEEESQSPLKEGKQISIVTSSRGARNSSSSSADQGKGEEPLTATPLQPERSATQQGSRAAVSGHRPSHPCSPIGDLNTNTDSPRHHRQPETPSPTFSASVLLSPSSSSFILVEKDLLKNVNPSIPSTSETRTMVTGGNMEERRATSTALHAEPTKAFSSQALDLSTAKSVPHLDERPTDANTNTESLADAWGVAVQIQPPADDKETTRNSRKQSCSVTTTDVDVGYESGTQGPSSRRLTAYRLSISLEGCTGTPLTNPDATDGGGQGEASSRSRSPYANRRQSNGDAYRTFSSHSSGLTEFRLTFPPSPHIDEKPPQRGVERRRRSTVNSAASPFQSSAAMATGLDGDGGNFITATATPNSCGPTTPEVQKISNNSNNDTNTVGGKRRESVAASMWGHVRSRQDTSSAPGSIVDPRDVTQPSSSQPPSFSTVVPHIVESGDYPQLKEEADRDECVQANTTLAFDDDKATGPLNSNYRNNFSIPVVVVGTEGVAANTSLSSLGAMAASATPRATLLNANTFSQGEAGSAGGGAAGGGGQRRVSIYEEPKPNGRKHSRSVSISASLCLDVPVERRRSSAHKAEGDVAASSRPWMAHIRRGGGAYGTRLVEEHAEHCSKSSVVELRAWLCSQPTEKLADEIIKLRMLLFGRANESALSTAQSFTDLGSSHFLGGVHASLECSNNPSASGRAGFSGVDNLSFNQQYNHNAHMATVSYYNGTTTSPTSMVGPEPMPNAMLNLPAISNFGTVPCPVYGGRSRANSLAVTSMHEVRAANSNGANFSDVPSNAGGGLVSARGDLPSIAVLHNTKQQPHLLSPVRVPQPSLATHADHRLSCMSADSATQRIVKNYTFVGVIGRGQYGTVWQAIRDGGFFAIKSIPKAKLKPRFAMPRPSMDSCTPTLHVSGFPQVRPSQDHGALALAVGDRAPDRILPLFSAPSSIKFVSHRHSQAELVNVTDVPRPDVALASGSGSPPAPMMATTAPDGYTDAKSDQNQNDEEDGGDEEQHAWGGGVSLSKSNAMSLFCGADANAYKVLNSHGNASRIAHRQLPPAANAMQRSSPPRVQASGPESSISKVPSATCVSTTNVDVGFVDEAETSVRSEFSVGSTEEPANRQSPSVVTPVFALKSDAERDRTHRKHHVQINAPPANDDEHDFLPAMTGHTSHHGAILNFQSIQTSLVRGRGFEGAEERDVNGGSHSPPPPPLGKDIAYSINFANSLSSRVNLPATSQSTAAIGGMSIGLGGSGRGGGGGEVMLGSGTLMSPPTASSISIPNGLGGGGVVFETTSEMKKEIEVMKALRHRNIVSLTEVLDEPDDSYIYLVMPYIEKGPIVTLVDNQCTPLHIDKIASYLLQVLSAVRYLHNKEIVHCDIKPDNILIGGDGQAYLVDFGVSQMFKSTPYNDNEMDHTDNDDSSFAQSHANTHSILSSYSQQFAGSGGGAPPRDRGGATVYTPIRSGRQSPRMQLSRSNTQNNIGTGGHNEAPTLSSSGGAAGYYGSGQDQKSRATASSSGTEAVRGGGPTTIVGLGNQSPYSTASLTVVDMVSSGTAFGRVSGGGQAHSTVVPSSSSRPPKEASRAQSSNAPAVQPLSSSSGEFSSGAYTPSMASLPPPGARRIDSRFSNVTTRPNGSCPSSAGLTRMTGAPLTSQGKDTVYFYGHRQHRPSIQYKHGYALSSTKCSPAFAAPETLVPYGEFNGAKADMWSLGITLYVLLFGRTPYTGVTASAVFKQIEDPDFIEFNSPLSDKNYAAAKRVVALIKKYNCDETPMDHLYSKANLTAIEGSSEQASESFLDHGVLVAIAASSSVGTPTSSPPRRDLPLGDDDGSSSPLPAVGIGKGRSATHLSAAQSASEMLVSLSANVTAEDPKEIERLEESLQDMSSTCALQAAVHALGLRTTYNANASWSPEEMDEMYEYACVLNPSELTLLGFSPESPIVKKYTLCLTLLTKLLDRDPAKRISANTAISDVFFKELDPAARTLREIRQRQMARSKPTK